MNAHVILGASSRGISRRLPRVGVPGKSTSPCVALAITCGRRGPGASSLHIALYYYHRLRYTHVQTACCCTASTDAHSELHAPSSTDIPIPLTSSSSTGNGRRVQTFDNN